MTDRDAQAPAARPAVNLTRSETAARSAAVTVHGYDVGLDLTGAPDPQREGFPVTVEIELTAAGETWLDFIGASVETVEVDGTPIAVEYDGARITLPGPAGRCIVRIEATARYSRTGEGMHRFTDPVDGETYLYTQYEPADCRRVFPCFEQPDMKAPFTFTVTAPVAWEVVSNREPVRRGIVPARVRRTGLPDAAAAVDAVRVEFGPTLPVSTYITAIVAGPYHRVQGQWCRGGSDCETLSVPLGVLCRKSLAQHLDADEILEVTKAGLEFYHDEFDYPYPWGKYDQVFVPEYNLGAMENPGCVTFTEKYLFRGGSTRAQHEARATTILHEMAHMWFGDLVTMRWWDDLWLKESFADYMGTLACAEATEFTEAWVAFAERRKAWAYKQDQLPTTHPIVADIPDLEAAKLNFDGITYAKGAAVLKQLVAYVGRAAFFEASRRYFRAHAFGNTTLDDLLVELSAASGRELRPWAGAWLRTSGVSALSLEWGGPDGRGQVGSGGPPEVVQTGLRPHRLAIGRYDFAGDADTTRPLVRVDRQEIELPGRTATGYLDVNRTPVTLEPSPLILLNEDDLTYAKARLDEASLETAEGHLSSIEDPLARALVWSALWNAVRDGLLDPSRYLRTVQRHGPREANTALLASGMGNAATAIAQYVPRRGRDAHRAEWLETAWEAVQDGGGLPWLRALAAAATVDDGRAAEIRALLDGTLSLPDVVAASPAGRPQDAAGPGVSAGAGALDPDVRWALWTALAATGHATAAELDAELESDGTASGRIAHMRALAARPSAEVKREARNRAVHDDSLTNDQVDALIGGFAAGQRRDLTGAFDEVYYAETEGVWATRSIEIARRIVLGLFPQADSTADADAWLEAHPDAPAALRRLVMEQRDHLARSIRVRGRW